MQPVTHNNSMPRTTDPRVDAYLERAAPFARPILRHLRTVVHKSCPVAEETLKWGHPSFTYHGKILCGMAAFKAHCTFGFWHAQMTKMLQRDFKVTATAMGHLGRLEKLADLPPDRTLRAYIQRAAELLDAGVPARKRPKPKPEAKVPPDLAAALKKSKKAAATFTGFSPSHRREYIEWITEAKRDETRASRLATTLEWLAQGKPRNWKYLNC
jgi:uncharacterized protein YdeI (YjbR/CyaY-like superfamily)